MEGSVVKEWAVGNRRCCCVPLGGKSGWSLSLEGVCYFRYNFSNREFDPRHVSLNGDRAGPRDSTKNSSKIAIM